ncbi:hypothetical protein GCM10027601_20690 [Nocardioides ungokensis]
MFRPGSSRALAAAAVCFTAVSLAGCATDKSNVLTAEEAAPSARVQTKQAKPVDAVGSSRGELNTYVAAARKQLPGLWSP